MSKNKSVREAVLELLESGKRTTQRNVNFILGRNWATNLSGDDLKARRSAIAEFSQRTEDIGTSDHEHPLNPQMPETVEQDQTQGAVNWVEQDQTQGAVN